MARLEDLPIFELSLAKKKKDKGKDKGDKNKNDINNNTTNSEAISNINSNEKEPENKKNQNNSKNNQNKGNKPDNVQPKKEKPEKMELSDPILNHFLKIKFVVGQITACENHQEADKLLVETININEATPRNVCSGIKAHYSPNELVGKKVLLFANLPTRKMVGVKSEGMLLCAESGATVKVIELADANVGDVVMFDGISVENYEW